ncbi:zinc finger protein 83-like isoform X3 [Adelges cooleyi]|uniref:zinc finger protein 83-like isoform X3 n=1 Tax=Adelges cooleyi TaxID=133065 RepID=UPI0021806A4C|nr:zinc finger protein 83-like isoform X3 [Adelges cooleyi]
MINGINVKREFDDTEDKCLESLLQIEETMSINMQVTNNLAGEKCDLCLESFTSEKQFKHHITTSHNGISKIDDTPIKKEFDNGFENYDMINGIHVKHEFDEMENYCFESLIQVDETRPIDMQVTNNLAVKKSELCLAKKQLKHHITTSHNGIPMTDKRSITTDVENEFKDNEMINEVNVKHKYDAMEDCCFESLIQVEETTSEDNKVTNILADKKCELCLESFTSEKQFKHHITTSHNGISKIDDTPIKKEFDNGFDDNRTKNEVNKNTDGCYFESKIETDNNKQTATKYNNEDITNRRVFQCNLCQKMYYTKNQITLHILKYHQCSADKHFPQKLNTIRCNEFTKSYANISRPYECDVCLKHFSTSSNLTQHKRMHTGEKPYKCNVCKNTFSRNDLLTIHERVHTGEKPYICDVCQKNFSQKSSLTKHKRVHTGEKPYKCDVCKMPFSHKSTLSPHKRLHTGEKPYKCNVCEKTFSVKGTLTKHERVHTGEKPYKCNVCEKTFSVKGTLTKHERVHTGEKPYKCNVCKNNFAQKEHLTRHERVHTGEKPYICDVCQKTFSQKTNLRKHKRVHTGYL